jgi:hypothetical protein
MPIVSIKVRPIKPLLERTQSMNPLTILDDIRIASPCEADWEQMAGDERTRFCADCSKHVYNIAAMTAEEATSLILSSEGRLCVQIYRRHDGTVLTADCPVGLGRVSAGRRLRRALALGLVLPALAVAGLTAKGIGKRRIDPIPSGPGVTWDDRIDWALVTLGIRKARMSGKGGMVDVDYTYDPTATSDNSSLAASQRARMQAAGIPIPNAPAPASRSNFPDRPGSPPSAPSAR